MMDIQKRIDKAIETLTHLPVPQGPSQALIDDTLAEVNALEDSVAKHRSGRSPLRILCKMGLVAMVMIGIGVLLGRATYSPALSEAQLEQLKLSLLASLSPEITAEIQERCTSDWQRALVLTQNKLTSDMDRQMDAKLNQYALGVLAVSQAKTQQTLGELVALFRRSEAYQQQRFDSALHKLAYDHFLRDSQVRNTLASVTDVTKTHIKHTEDLISLVAHEHKNVNDPNLIKF